ncbi:MAG: S9 family peptidase [Chloroflexi bacterium]|nr:S9 family peptidase [Chloroflexota bacterium]
MLRRALAVFLVALLLLPLAGGARAKAGRQLTVPGANEAAGPSSTETIPGWTIADMMSVGIIGAVAVSPDGRRIAYAVSRALMTEDRSEMVSQVFVADSDGGNTAQLTRGERSSHSPRWSPDGKQIAFLSDQSGGSNIWLASAQGGEARQITNVESAVLDFRWSPSGERIAFTMPDPPTEEEVRNLQQMNDAEVLDENIKQIRLWVVSVPETGATDSPRLLTPQDFSVMSWDWAPDEKSIAFAHVRTPAFGDGWTSDISKVDLATSQVTALAGSEAAETMPMFSPDGRWIAFAATDVPAFDFSLVTVYITGAEGGDARPLARTPNEAPTLIGWSRDADFVYFTEDQGTAGAVGALAVDGKGLRALSTTDYVIQSATLNQARTAFGIVMENVASPMEVYVSSVDAFDPVKASNVNGPLTRLPIPRVETVRWRSSDGAEIEGLLTYPLDYQAGDRYPLLVNPHGGPALNWKRSFHGSINYYPVPIFAARGYAVLQPNIRGSNGYGAAFRKANIKDWGGMDFQDLMSGVDSLIAQGTADPDRLGIMGWSYGGYMTAWAITQSDRFKAASVGAGPTNLMSMAGTSDWTLALPYYLGGRFWDGLDLYLSRSPIAHVKNVTAPTLIQHGVNDPRVPFGQAQEFYSALKAMGRPVKMVAYPRFGHGEIEPRLIMDVMQRNLEWFEKWIPAQASIPAPNH